MEPQENDLQTVIKLCKSLGEFKTINDVPAVMVPEGYIVETYPDLEKSLTRIKERRLLQTVESFIEYVTNYDTGNTVLFIDDARHEFFSIFDYHRKGKPDHCSFEALYTCPFSSEWKTWDKHNKQKMSQWEFAEFLENNIGDIFEPSGAEMLSCALALESTKKADFASSIRLSDGQVQLKYEETIQGAQKNNSVNIPEEFYIGIPVFKKGEAYRVKAKLRYRINDSNLSMWYELFKPEQVVDDAFDGVKERVTKEIAVPAYI